MNAREQLWEDVTFFLVPREVTATEVVNALDLDASFEQTTDRRFALAETLMRGDYNGPSEEMLAVFSHKGFTWVAPPAMVFAATGEQTWPRALSQAFGTCHAYTTTIGAPRIIEFQDGEPTAEVSDIRVTPETGLFGLTERIQDNATILDALEKYVGSSLRDVFDSGETELWKRNL